MQYTEYVLHVRPEFGSEHGRILSRKLVRHLVQVLVQV